MTDHGAGHTGWCLLGPIRLVVRGVDVDLGPAKQRCVLAALLLTPGWTVPTDTLVERVWGERPPRAPNPAAPYVTRLRRILAGRAAELGCLQYAAGGYRIDCDPERVDLHRARRLAARARSARAAGDDAAAADLLGAALAGWNPVPLAGLAGEWAARTRAALTREWLDLHVERADANLRLRRYAEVVEELRPLVAEQPSAEGLAAALMRALAGSGRPAEALDCYATVRAAISRELGTEPCRQLADVQLRILRNDPDLTRPTPAAVPERAGPAVAEPRRRPPRPVPAELPGDVAAFTGRRAELAHLDRVLSDRSDGAPAASAVVSGTAGVGKTALALHWAHRARQSFPDGQLYVNLRGYDPEQPMTAAGALARLLASLGVAEHQVPVEADERAARYRTELADRRMLIVLDNASSVQQVRPLLPGTPACRVLVTSRDSLTGLVVRDGARRVELDLLPLPEAVALLRRLIGPRVEANPEAARTLAVRCARLPLALRVAAELAAGRPSTPLDRLIDDPDGPRRLELLDVEGDPHTAVQAVFSWSVRQLPAETARTFALLGLHPGAELDAHAAAALAGDCLEESRRALDRLAAAHLIRPVTGTGSGSGTGTDTGDGTGTGGGSGARYGMHDLLRTYAVRLAGPERAAALGRLVDYYLGTAAAAMDRLHPAEVHRRPRIAAPATPAPVLADPAAARGWLDQERTTLVAIAAHAAAHGRPRQAVQLSVTLFRYLAGGHSTDGLSIHGHARAAAAASGDGTGEAQALIGIGTIHLQLGRHETALRYLGRARALSRRVGDLVSEARALSNLGVVEERLGRYRAAAGHQQQAVVLHRQTGDWPGLARGLNNLGDVQTRLGRHGEAADQHAQALAIFRQIGDQTGEADALNHLGSTEGRLGRREAVQHLEQAVALYRQLGDRFGEAQALDSLGTVELRLGRTGRATEHYEAALTLFRRAGGRDAEAWVHNGLGEAALAAGRPDQALTHHTTALGCATETGVPDQQARANLGLAAAHRQRGDLAQSRHHYQRALDLYTRLGSPDAHAVNAELTTLEPPARLPLASDQG